MLRNPAGRKTLRHGPLTAMGILLASFAAGAQPVLPDRKLQIIGPARPPYIVDHEGVASGLAIELVTELAASIGVPPKARIMPFQRAIMALNTGNTLYPALLRTPDREKKYLWIGEVFADRAVFFTRKPMSPVNTIDDARRLPSITVMRGSELQGMLATFGLQNVEANASERDNARLLANDRIDSWFTLKSVGRASWVELDFNPAELRAGETMAAVSFWIAASANLPPATVTKLRATYRAMRNDGRYDRIVAPLAALNAPP